MKVKTASIHKFNLSRIPTSFILRVLYAHILRLYYEFLKHTRHKDKSETIFQIKLVFGNSRLVTASEQTHNKAGFPHFVHLCLCAGPAPARPSINLKIFLQTFSSFSAELRNNHLLILFYVSLIPVCVF